MAYNNIILIVFIFLIIPNDYSTETDMGNSVDDFNTKMFHLSTRLKLCRETYIFVQFNARAYFLFRRNYRG